MSKIRTTIECIEADIEDAYNRGRADEKAQQTERSIHDTLCGLIVDTCFVEVVACLDMVAKDNNEGVVVWIKEFEYPASFNHD